MVRNDSTVNFDWGSGSPQCTPLQNDNFSVQWTGYVSIPTTGDWTFYIRSNDGMRFDLELTPGAGFTTIVSDWSDHSARERSATQTLSAGWYKTQVWYYDNNGNAEAQLSYSGPGLAKTIIPSTNMRTCTSPCSSTAPSGLGTTAVTSTSAQLNWTPGTGGTKQLIRVDKDQNDVDAGCPGGIGVDADEATGTKCVVKDDNVPSGQSTYGTGSVLTAGTRYYFQVVEYKDATCSAAAATSSFTTRSDPWVKIMNGLVHANHMTSLRVAPVGQNSRWMISARGSVTGTSQEGWISQYYPERNFSLTSNTPITAPAYADLWKRFGGGATTYAGPTLPNADGVYIINGNKTVNAVFNQAGGANTLVFVDGNLTIGGEIRTASNGTLVFIVSGEIKFAKNLTGGGGGVDNLGGLYVASGRINTAYDKSAPDEITRQLVIEGGLISLTDTILLDRNLDPTDNQITPAEQIDLSAKYYVLLKSVLGRPKFFYQEVPAGF